MPSFLKVPQPPPKSVEEVEAPPEPTPKERKVPEPAKGIILQTCFWLSLKLIYSASRYHYTDIVAVISCVLFSSPLLCSANNNHSLLNKFLGMSKELNNNSKCNRFFKYFVEHENI